jgi:hypothetical protein
MSKKHKKQGQTVLIQEAHPPLDPASLNNERQTAQPLPGTPPQSAPAPDFSRKYFFIFWGIIIIAALAAWILAVLLPGVSESVIERWIMAALAVSLAVFLSIYK